MQHTKTKAFKVYFDGACEPRNPDGNMGWGFVVLDPDGNRIKEYSDFKLAEKGNTNNWAEYNALLEALIWLYHNDYANEKIKVFGDSQLVVKQMNREWGIKSGGYVKSANRCLEAQKHFTNISFTWIPREQNSEADAMSKAELERRGIKEKDWKGSNR